MIRHFSTVDWDFKNANWELSSLHYVSSPSSLHFTASGNNVKIKTSVVTNSSIKEGRLLLDVYSPEANKQIEIVFRYIDDDNYYVFVPQSGSSVVSQIYKRKDGSNTSLKSTTSSWWALDEWKEIRVTWWCDTADRLIIRVEYFNGSAWEKIMDEAIDNSQNWKYGGRTGLGDFSISNTANSIFIDDVEIWGILREEYTNDFPHTVSINQNISLNSVESRPPSLTVNITKVLVKSTRDSMTLSISGLTESRVTNVRDSSSLSLSTLTESFDIMKGIFDEGGVAFWTLVAGSESDDTTEKKSGANSYKIQLSTQTLDMYHDYGSNEDMSDKDNIYLYFYGGNSGTNIRIEFWNEVYAGKTNGYYYSITDNFVGWKRFIIPRADFTNIGTPTGWANIRCVRLLGSSNVTETYRVDWFARTNMD